MWRASADAVVNLLVEQPGATTQQISLVLCKLDGPSADCKDGNGPAPDVIQLGPQLFAAALFSGEVGTVFIVGPRKGKPTLLWSIEDATHKRWIRGVCSARGSWTAQAESVERPIPNTSQEHAALCTPHWVC